VKSLVSTYARGACPGKSNDFTAPSAISHSTIAVTQRRHVAPVPHCLGRLSGVRYPGGAVNMSGWPGEQSQAGFLEPCNVRTPISPKAEQQQGAGQEGPRNSSFPARSGDGLHGLKLEQGRECPSVSVQRRPERRSNQPGPDAATRITKLPGQRIMSTTKSPTIPLRIQAIPGRFLRELATESAAREGVTSESPLLAKPPQ